MVEWDTGTWSIRRRFTIPDTGGLWAESSVLYSVRDGSFLLLDPRADRWNGRILWWSLERSQIVAELLAHPGSDLDQMAASPDGRLLASAGSATYVGLWDVNTREPVCSMRGNLLAFHSVRFSPDGSRLATGGSGREAVKLWDLETHQEVLTLDGQGMLFSFIRFSPDGNTVVAINGQDQAHVWRAPSLKDIAAAELAR